MGINSPDTIERGFELFEHRAAENRLERPGAQAGKGIPQQSAYPRLG